MATTSTEPGFRWRIIPAWFLMAFGGLLCLGWMFWIPIVLFIPEASRDSGYPHDLASATLFCIAGAMWVIAGKMILNRHWWWMLTCLVLGYAAGVSGSMLMDADETRREANSVVPLLPDQFRTSTADSQSNR